MSSNQRPSAPLVILGGLLIFFGAMSLTSMLLGPVWEVFWRIVGTTLKFIWPIALIGLGIFIITVGQNTSFAPTFDKNRRLYRSNDRVLGGVCAGIAEYFSIDPTWVRLGVVLLAILSTGGPVIIAYIICWIVLPERS